MRTSRKTPADLAPLPCSQDGERESPKQVGNSQSLSSQSGAFEINVVRSARRKKTISARLLNWYTMEVRAPADIPEAELQRAIRDLAERMEASRSKLRQFASDQDLERRAQRLNQGLFGGALRWRSIRFVSNQNTCFGSCTPVRGTIRISHRLAGAPSFVLDYVITHELAHLLEPSHSAAFWKHVYRYERTERARGYLMAMQLESDRIDHQAVADPEVGG